jgi:hypothetical protein
MKPQFNYSQVVELDAGYSTPQGNTVMNVGSQRQASPSESGTGIESCPDYKSVSSLLDSMCRSSSLHLLIPRVKRGGSFNGSQLHAVGDFENEILIKQQK